jgi:hypothetical protein
MMILITTILVAYENKYCIHEQVNLLYDQFLVHDINVYMSEPYRKHQLRLQRLGHARKTSFANNKPELGCVTDDMRYYQPHRSWPTATQSGLWSAISRSLSSRDGYRTAAKPQATTPLYLPLMQLHSARTGGLNSRFEVRGNYHP